MFEKLEELRATKRDYETKMRTEAKTALQQALGEFFAAHPQVLSVSWTQYTPYFNDGDACYFRCGDAGFFFQEDVTADYLRQVLSPYRIEAATDEQLVTNFAGEEGESVCSYDRLSSYELADGGQLATDFEALSRGVDSLDDVLEGLFGDHVRVTCTAEGVETEEYSHD